MSTFGVAIVGAGPYGLSLAAHLSAKGLRPRVFGRPMETWFKFMPKGMVLKSEGFAMDLSEPEGSFRLRDYCAAEGIAYKSVGWPVPVEVFAAYGKAFQERFVPQVEEARVASITQAEGGFELTLDSGEAFVARNVIMATGIRPFSNIPAELCGLPAGAVSHSSEHGDMAGFTGRHVAVLGGGASAMDVAAALHRAGARVTVVTRGAEVRFFSPTSFRSMRDRLLAPMTPLGPGWKKFLCVKAPGLFRLLPASVRSGILQRYLGPAPAWSVHDIIEKHVDVRLRTGVAAASQVDEQVVLTLVDREGDDATLRVDHVIAATGYSVDVARVPALAQSLRDRLSRHGRAPVLSRDFETSVPGLFIVGTPSASSFGPMLRFVAGTPYASARVTRRVAARESSVRGAAGRDHAPVWKTHDGPVQV